MVRVYLLGWDLYFTDDVQHFMAAGEELDDLNDLDELL